MGGAIAAERGYYRRMVERVLERSGLPPYEALVANGERLLEPETIAQLRQAVERLDLLPPPATADELLGAATAKYSLGRYDEALADYNRALELRPDYTEALNNRGNTYHELERYNEALADYNQALELRQEYVEALYNRGNT